MTPKSRANLSSESKPIYPNAYLITAWISQCHLSLHAYNLAYNIPGSLSFGLLPMFFFLVNMDCWGPHSEFLEISEPFQPFFSNLSNILPISSFVDFSPTIFVESICFSPPP